MPNLRPLVIVAVTAATLAGCGLNPAATGKAVNANGAAAKRLPQSASQIFTVIQNAGAWVYGNLDLNKDGKVTEAESQTAGFSDGLFAKADGNKDYTVTSEEFSFWYATVNNAKSMAATRTHLAEDFAKLDANKDGFLSPTEVGVTDPAKLLGHPVGLALEGEQLVECGGFKAEDVKKADETKDGKLVRSEFEDLWAMTIKRRLGVK